MKGQLFMTSPKVKKTKRQTVKRPTREQAEDAVRTLIRWAGDDPEREGMKDTPRRVTKSYTEFFSGYDMNPQTLLSTTEVGL